MESFKFITPARVRVLLVPLGGIAPALFRRYAETVQSITDIRLLDISPTPECHLFNPQQFPQGRVFYSVSTEASNDDTTFLDDFEPFRKTFVVIGIGSNHNQDLVQVLDRDLESLKDQHPAAISHNAIYYQSSGKYNALQGVFHISPDAENIATSIETVLCQVTANFLLALEAYASSFDSITLRSPISLTDSRVLTRTINQAQKRLSSGLSFKALFANGQPVTPPVKDLKLKSLQRQTGRKAKLMGNFFLLAGRAQDALQYFIDAAINAKKTDDHLWLASALEGVSVASTVLLFLGLPHQIQNPMFTSVLHIPKPKGLSMMKASSKVSMESMVSRQSILAATPRNSTSSSLSLGANHLNSPTDVAQIQVIEFLLLLALRSSYFYKLSTSDLDDCVPDIVYVESLLRNVKLMTTVFLSSTSDTSAIIGALVRADTLKRQRGGADFHVLQQSIIAEIDQIFALQLNKLEFTEQCRIYCALASIYNDLGLHRKHGLVLRLLLEILIPKVSVIESTPPLGELGPLRSMKSIIEHLFYIYHIDAEPEKSGSLASRHYSDWIVLQLLLIKLCLRIAEAFQDYDTLMKLCVLTLSRFTHCLPVEDQIKLRDKLSWLSVVSNSGALNLRIPHPDPFMVRDAMFIVLSRSTSLVPFKIDEHNSSSKSNGQASSVFFDPYNKTSSTINMDKIICQNEVYQLQIVLQNPFYYNLEIRSIDVVSEKDLQLETLKSSPRVVSVMPLKQNLAAGTHGWKGASKIRKTITDVKQLNTEDGLIIPPNSFADVVISFRALTAGELQIQGFDVVFNHSQPQFFDIVDQEQFSGLEKITYELMERLTDDCGTLEKIFLTLLMSQSGNRVTKKVISLTAIHSQPTLTTVNNDKVGNWTMLLEGEVQSSSLQLKNCSNDSVDYLSISPWDSTIEPISSKLNLNSRQNRLNAAEVYELEFLLLEKKALCVTNKSEISSKFKVIQPGCEMKIDYDIIGKRTMTELKLMLEYGKKALNEQDQIFLKKLVVPFNVFVHRSLEIIANDIIPLFPSVWQSFSDSNPKASNDPTQATLDSLLGFISDIKDSSQEEVSDYCLLVLDIKNFWKETLTATINNSVGKDKSFAIEKSIAPNKSSRVFVPVRRIGDKLFDPFKVIPSLRNKQFVKNYSLSEDEEKQVRRSFWVKNELLKGLKGTWVTVDNAKQRSGYIDLRRLNLTVPMTDSLIYDDILISHKIFAEEENNVELKMHNDKFILEREKFYILKTRIVNHTDHSIVGVLRHLPFPSRVSNRQDLSIDQKILYNGVLQIHIGGDVLEAGGTYERELGFMILEKGQYEWGSIFDEFGEQQKRIIGREPVYIIVS